MKTPTLDTKTRSFWAVLSLVATLSASSAAPVIYQVDDWFTTNGRTTGIVNGNTNSPTIPQDPIRNTLGSSWGYFDAVTLTNGDSMTLDTAITIVTSGSGTFNPLRFGFFEHGTTATTGNSPNRISTSDPYEFGWSGFFADANGSDIYRRDTDNGSNATTVYYSTGVTNTSSFSDNPVSPTFTSGSPVSLSLTLQRSGDNLSFSGTLGGDTFSGTYSNAFASGYSAVFDTFGIYGNGFSAGNTITEIGFSNTTVTVVPEPSSLALLGAAGLGLLAFRRRKRQTA